MRGVLVGRHGLLPVQERMLQKLGIEIVRQVPQVPAEQKEIASFVRELKNENVEVIVIQALPINILAVLLQEAKKSGIKVLSFKQETIFTGDRETAEKLVSERPDRRTLLPSRENVFRVIEVKELAEIKEVRIVEETIIKAEEV